MLIQFYRCEWPAGLTTISLIWIKPSWHETKAFYRKTNPLFEECRDA